MADAHESRRQNVQQKPPDEFLGGQLHGFALPVAIVFVAKAHLSFIQSLDAMVADGDLVRVAAQILHHGFGFFDIGFTVHHPLVLHQLIELDFHLSSIEPGQLSLLPGAAQSADHGTAKMAGQGFDRKQVSTFRRVPLMLIA